MRRDSETGGESGRRSLFALIAILVGFEAITFWLSAKLNLYIDELYSLHTTGFGFREAIEQSLSFEQQPPFYFIALKAWRALNASDLFARQFSIACSLLTLVILWSYSRRFLAAIPAWILPFVVAINPAFVWAALDIRVYALVILLSAALISLYFEAFGTLERHPAKLALFTLVAAVGIYTQYFIGALLVGFALALLISDRRSRLLPFSVCMMIVALLVAPVVAGDVFHQVSQAATVEIVPPRIDAERMLGSLLGFIFPHYWTSGLPRLALAGYVVIVASFLIVILRVTQFRETQRSLALIVCAVTCCFLFIILALRIPLEFPRHIAVLLIPSIVAVTALITSVISGIVRSRLIVTFAMLCTAFGLATNAKTYKAPFVKVGDWARVGAYLSSSVQPTDSIAVFDEEYVLAVRHYYHGSARLISIPGDQDFEVFDRRKFAIPDASRLAAIFPKDSPVRRRVWLVLGDTACAMVEVGNSCAILDSFVRANYTRLDLRRFDGTTVYELSANH